MSVIKVGCDFHYCNKAQTHLGHPNPSFRTRNSENNPKCCVLRWKDPCRGSTPLWKSEKTLSVYYRQAKKKADLENGGETFLAKRSGEQLDLIQMMWLCAEAERECNVAFISLWNRYAFREHPIPWYMNKIYKRKRFYTPSFVAPYTRWGRNPGFKSLN